MEIAEQLRNSFLISTQKRKNDLARVSPCNPSHRNRIRNATFDDHQIIGFCQCVYDHRKTVDGTHGAARIGVATRNDMRCEDKRSG
jgi:hypothetical protein